MIAGNFISKMFENTSKQIELENSILKFTCEWDYETITKAIESFFIANAKDTKYTYTGNGIVRFYFMHLVLLGWYLFFRED